MPYTQRSSDSALPWLFGASAVGALAYLAAEHNRAQAAMRRRDRALTRILQRMADEVADVLGVGRRTVLLDRHVPNAQAECGLIRVNPNWLDGVASALCDGQACLRALAYFVIAHEVAHEAEFHACSFGPRHLHSHALEHRADMLAARALAELGATSREALWNGSAFLRGGASRSHPAGIVRRQLILQHFDVQLADKQRRDFAQYRSAWG